jgi:hypothetical protein
VKRLLFFVILSLVSLGARGAVATEGQLHTGAGVGIVSFTRSDAPVAPAVGVHAAYEISDMFDARVELLASQHEFVEEQKTLFYSGAAGLTYKLDILTLIPYAGILGGVYAFDGYYPYNELRPRKVQLGISVPFGLDWTISTHFGLGVQFRYHGILSDPLEEADDGPIFSGLLRAEWRFGS